jgi:hypothetical protein
MKKQRIISLPFFFLRAGTAGAALVTGLLQTFVFAHVLSPHRFSIFILVAAIGYSLWLIDFGIVKILFVRLRACFLAGKPDKTVSGHATAIVLFYFSLITTGALACFVFMATQTESSLREAAEFGLFFWFIALNLVWFALRNIAIAFDEYVLFEVLETVRRAGYFLGLAAVLFGLPLIILFIALNTLWAVVLAICLQRMIARGALLPSLRGFVAHLRSFVHANRKELVRSGTYAATEIYTYNYPYLIIPLLFGLGSPPIILDTTFKVFRGGSVIFSAVTDIVVPRQTSALAARDGPTLVRVTVLGVALCALPAAIISAILLIGADRLFALLLGHAATMPPAVTPILIAMLFVDLTKMITHSVLVHNGYFKEVSRVGMGVVVAMTALGAFALVTHLDIVQFLAAYTAVYAGGAVAALVMMVRGPIRRAYASAPAPIAPQLPNARSI